MLGAGGAGIAQAVRAGRFGFALVGIAIYPAIYLGQIFGNPYLMVGWMMSSYAFGVLGLESEMRRRGGFDVEPDPQPGPR
jgi:hypothetical protein